MNQLALFEALPVPAPVAGAMYPTTKRHAAASGAAAGWAVGMLVRLPITATIEGEQWRQYTMGLSGRIEVIEGDLAGVRIDCAGHKFGGRLAVAHMAGLSANN